ncbi:MAG: YggU family protein [Candidatus Magasanikbacteria bacterium]|nr:YggU family protein [Candidatus Magasanikbacteria bacterium]
MSQTIKIKVIPRAGKNEIAGKMADGTLKIKLKAPPVNGKANEELVKFLSKEWGVKKGCVRIIQGKTGRRKIIEVGDK